MPINFKKLVFILFLLIPAIHMFFQLKKLDIEDGENCLKLFKSNNMLGLIIFINLLIGKLI